MNVLIIDDDTVTNEILKRFIDKKYKDIYTFYASNGEDAYEIMCTINISLIILDIQMPIMNGEDFMRKYLNFIRHV